MFNYFYVGVKRSQHFQIYTVLVNKNDRKYRVNSFFIWEMMIDGF